MPLPPSPLQGNPPLEAALHLAEEGGDQRWNRRRSPFLGGGELVVYTTQDNSFSQEEEREEEEMVESPGVFQEGEEIEMTTRSEEARIGVVSGLFYCSLHLASLGGRC